MVVYLVIRDKNLRARKHEAVSIASESMSQPGKRQSFRVSASRAFISWIALALSVANTAPAQQPELPAEIRTRLEDTVSKFMSANSAPGVAVAVVQNSQHVWSEGFGMADLENNVPVTAQTLFRLASVSKPITATAAMQLWERQQLDLDAPVQKYCPAFPKKEFPISTRQLLGHLGGIRHYRSDDDQEVNNTKHFEEPITGGIQFFANDSLIAKPGTKFSYSTQGFTLIGCAIEGASSRKYTDFVRENVFGPAGMLQTQWDDRFAIIPRRTRFYSKSKSGAVINADFLDASYKIPGGGWISSADDMANFEVAILSDRLLKRSTRDAMWTPPLASIPEIGEEGHRSYALGWGVGTIAGASDIGHGGGQQGTSTFVMLIPARGLGVVVLINMDGLDASALATNLMQILLAQADKRK
jgi:serine beta-lactamase-like protein LACTB, mitochondrial